MRAVWGALLAAAAWPALADVEFVTVTGQAHFAEVWLHNRVTSGPTTWRYEFDVDGLPVVVVNRQVPNNRPDDGDFLFIESLPAHIEADRLEIVVEENDSGVIRLFWKLLG